MSGETMAAPVSPARRGGDASFLRAVGLTFAGSTVTLLASVANSILVSRALGPEGRGTYALATAAVVLVWPLAGLGLQHANVFWASRAPERAPILFWHSLLYVTGVGMALAALYAAWPAWLRALLGGTAPDTLAWLVLAATALVMLTEQVASLLSGLQRFHAYNLVRSGVALLLPPVNLVALLAFGAGATGVVAVWAAVNGVVMLLAVALLRYRTPLPWRLDHRQFVASLSTGTRGLLGAIAGMLLLRVDVFLVGHWAGLTAVGFYASAVLLAELALRLPDMAGKVLFPMVAGDDTQAGDALTVRVIRFTLVLGLFGAAALAIAGRPLIVAAFGGAFAPAYPALLWLLPGMVALALAVVVNHNLAGRGYPLVTITAPLAALTINLAVNALTIPRWGASGASIASSVAYCLWAALLLRHFARRSGAGWRELLVPSSRDIADTRGLIARIARREG